MILNAIAKAFDLSMVRARSTLRAAVFNFLFVAGVTGLKSATNALYLARRGPSDLPWLYLGTALIVTVITAFYGKRLVEVSAKYVLRKSVAIWAALIFGLGILAVLDFQFAYGVLYVAGEAFATSLSILYWARLGEIYDVRAAKRVTGSIAAAGMLGAVIGGLVVTGLAAASVPAVVWCFVTPILVVMTRPLLGAAQTPGSMRRERVTFRDGMAYAAGKRFPLGIAALVLLFAVHAAAIDFVFRTGTHRFEQGNEGEMASLFGLLNAVVGVLSILFQVFLTRQLLKRLGVFMYLSIVPALSIVAAVIAFVFPQLFWPLFIMKVLEMMASYSLNQTGFQILYNPVPNSVRGSVRAVIDGAVKKMGGAIGGIVLLLVGASLALEVLLAVVCIVGVVLLIWIFLLRPRYLVALRHKLGNRGVGPIPIIDPSDHETRQHLIRAMEDDDGATTLAAITVLEQDAEFSFKKHIGTLISHPAEEVRTRVIELIHRSPSDDYVPFLAKVIASENHHARAQAARALVMIDPVTARRVLEPVLKDLESERNFRVVNAAIVALLGGDRMTEDDGGIYHFAREKLDKMLEGLGQKSTAERRDLARVLGQLGPGRYAPRIAEFLQDKNELVRTEAVVAAGIAQDESLPMALVEILSDRTVQMNLRKTLAAYGNSVVPLLAKVLDDRRVEVSARVQIPAILRSIATKEAANAMLFSNRHDDAYLRHVIIEELNRMRRRLPELSFDRQQTQGAALRRLRAYRHYLPMAEDMALAGGAYELLSRALDDRVTQNLHAGLRLLGLIYDHKAMENGYHGLLQFEDSAHGDAVELIDVALGQSRIRKEVLQHIEPSRPTGEAERANKACFALVEGRDIQLAMVAAETLLRTGQNPPAVREPTSGEPLMPKSIVERVFLLQSVQFFRTLSVDDLSAVAAICKEGHAERREVIYEEGDSGGEMFVIISGGIRLLSKGEPLIDLHAGDSFGQTSVLDGGRRPVTAHAGEEGADYMSIARQPMLDLMADRPALVNGLFAELGMRIRELIDLSHGAGAQSLRARPNSTLRPR